MTELWRPLDRTIFIEANRETVFRFFTDSARWAAWWGAGSKIDARAGGAVLIRYPNAVEVSGEVVEIAAPERIVFTYGYASGNPIPPGASRVTIQLERRGDGTLLSLKHEFTEAPVRDMHVQGWRFQLSVFANAVADELHRNAQDIVDGWYAAWMVADEAPRRAALEKVVQPGISFRDRYSLLEGIDDLMAHISASQRFMPGMTLQRRGTVRQCQGTALTSWAAVASDGTQKMAGTSVFRLGSDGKLKEAVSVSE